MTVKVTLSVSPLVTDRVAPKLPAEYRTPVVPPLVWLVIEKAPLIVAVPLMLNVAAEAARLADAAVPKLRVGRFELL